MPYNSGGARLAPALTRAGNIQTKKRLKELIRDTPHLVHFTCTDGDFGQPRFSGTLDQFTDENTTLMVHGPDPYHDRKWIANIRRTPQGLKVT